MPLAAALPLPRPTGAFAPEGYRRYVRQNSVHYRVAIADSELDRVRAVRDKALSAVLDDGWALLLDFGSTVLRFTPEEVATPDDSHPLGDVTRPRVDDATDRKSVV